LGRHAKNSDAGGGPLKIAKTLALIVLPALLLALAGCSPSKDSAGFKHFEPNARVMLAKTDSDWIMANAPGEREGVLKDLVSLNPGTEAIVESDDSETHTYSIHGETRPRRRVEILVLDGPHKGVRCSVDFANLREIPSK
jgi:hypothetical protein